MRQRRPPLASPRRRRRVRVIDAPMPYLSFYHLGLYTRIGDVNINTVP